MVRLNWKYRTQRLRHITNLIHFVCKFADLLFSRLSRLVSMTRRVYVLTVFTFCYVVVGWFGTIHTHKRHTHEDVSFHIDQVLQLQPRTERTGETFETEVGERVAVFVGADSLVASSALHQSVSPRRLFNFGWSSSHSVRD